MVKVIATDMDGTFLDHRGLYDRERFETVLKELDHQDIRFVVASGNNMGRLSLMFEGFLDRIAFVADNGCHVIDRGEELVRRTMDRQLVADFLAYYQDKQSDYCISITTANGLYLLENAHFPFNHFAIEAEQMALFLSRIKRLTSFSELPDEPILKLGMMLPEEQCDDIITGFNTHFSGNLTATTSGYGSVDVIETGLHKAWGLQHLLDKWGVSAEDLMAFGDGGNDIEMLQLAHHSYAMDNAPDAVKEAAHFLAPNHRDHGVLSVIEREVLTKI
ncbi:Cof-type HAD-IIB family hydrolase [Streptococcus entericus]|uniref:Cof-type HAD-IIB family hydrolase n=1 Tax=Streptococcus entericus TaxID=155680 RepID=UPI0003779537|nr:Cof-type HAD-IIB family hydrolase [Streptococcus entericus]